MNRMPIIDPRLDSLKVTVKDATLAGHCVRGARQWFEHHGFDFRTALKEGIPARDLLATGDGHAVTVIRAKLARMDKGE